MPKAANSIRVSVIIPPETWAMLNDVLPDYTHKGTDSSKVLAAIIVAINALNPQPRNYTSNTSYLQPKK